MIIIGSVKVDVHKSDRKLDLVNFSDVDCIKGLIKNRSRLDAFFDCRHDKASSVSDHYDSAGIVSPVAQEVIVMYAALDEYLDECDLNIKQAFIIKKLMQGHTESDVAKMFKANRASISTALNTVANKIKKINDLRWKYDFIYGNIIKANFSYKECISCNEPRPATEDFFGRDGRNRDGLKSYCKKCEISRKKK